MLRVGDYAFETSTESTQAHEADHDAVHLLYNGLGVVRPGDSIQAMVDLVLNGNVAAGASSARAAKAMVYIDAGTHILTTPIKIYSAVNLGFFIHPAAKLLANANMTHVLDICGVNNLHLFGQGLIEIADGVTVTTPVQIRSDTGLALILSKGVHLHGLKVQTAGAGAWGTGLKIGSATLQAGGANTLQCDEVHLRSVGVDGRNHGDFGIVWEGAWGNQTNMSAKGCYSNQCTVAYKIYAMNNVTAEDCHCDGGGAGAGGARAWEVTSLKARISGRIESYAAALLSGGPNGNGAQVTFDCEYHGQEMVAAEFIHIRQPGTWTLNVTCYNPAVTPSIKVNPGQGDGGVQSKVTLKGDVIINSASNRPAAADLVSGANWRGSLEYTQQTGGPAWISAETVSQS